MKKIFHKWIKIF